MGRTGEVLAAFLPVLLLVLGGYLGQRTGRMDASLRSGLERIGYHVFLPALLFQNLASSAASSAVVLPLLVLTVVSILLASAAMLGWCRFARTPHPQVGPLVQASMRFNNFLGFSLLLPLFGPVGLAAGAIVSTFSVIVANTVAVTVLLVYAGKEPPGLLRLGRELVRNPLIQASAAGLLFKALGVELPETLGQTLSMLGQAGIVVGLIVVGAALAAAPSALVPLRALLPAALVKFLLLPGIAFAMARMFGLDPVVTAAITMFFALPTAPASYLLSRQLGADADLMAGLIVAESVLALLALPAVVLLTAP
ncbi:AEC family transporter [Geminicoccus roseus]|uniref:AEC family transporter n=1 Tax=Geminicoccus roseus TaxID=404900 RepID=UPI00040AF825|nr:AEC family transporter [Geminicoccus roseus]